MWQHIAAQLARRATLELLLKGTVDVKSVCHLCVPVLYLVMVTVVFIINRDLRMVMALQWSALVIDASPINLVLSALFDCLFFV